MKNWVGVGMLWESPPRSTHRRGGKSGRPKAGGWWMPETQGGAGEAMKTSVRSAGRGTDFTSEYHSMKVETVTLGRGWIKEGRVPGWTPYGSGPDGALLT